MPCISELKLCEWIAWKEFQVSNLQPVICNAVQVSLAALRLTLEAAQIIRKSADRNHHHYHEKHRADHFGDSFVLPC